MKRQQSEGRIGRPDIQIIKVIFKEKPLKEQSQFFEEVFQLLIKLQKKV
jgi:hypothetical protein